jgi:hypothetical protein
MRTCQKFSLKIAKRTKRGSKEEPSGYNLEIHDKIIILLIKYFENKMLLSLLFQILKEHL